MLVCVSNLVRKEFYLLLRMLCCHAQYLESLHRYFGRYSGQYLP